MSRILLLAKVLIALSLSVVPAAAQQAFTLKYGHVTAASDDSDDHIAGLWLKDFLEGRSQGRLKVEIYPASQLGDFRKMLEQVQLGTLELAQTTVGGVASFVPEIQVFDIPYIIPNDRVATKLASGPMMDMVREEVLKRTKNIRLVAAGNTGNWRSFFTTVPVKSVGDLKGVKIRTIDSPLEIEFVKSLGSNPVPLPWAEVYTGLSTGVIQGVKNSAADVVRFKLSEVAKNGFIDDHTFLFGFYWMSDRWLKQLPPDLQGLVVDGLQQAASIMSRINERDEGLARATFIKQGGKLVFPADADKQALLKHRDTMKAWFVAKYGDAWVVALDKAIAQAESELAEERKRIVR